MATPYTTGISEVLGMTNIVSPQKVSSLQLVEKKSNHYEQSTLQKRSSYVAIYGIRSQKRASRFYEKLKCTQAKVLKPLK